MDSPIFKLSFDRLPVSNNEYLRASIQYTTDDKPYVHYYETKKSKDFKKIYREALLREVHKTNWDKQQTEDGHWYLECTFRQSRTNQDSNNYFKVLLDSLTGYVIMDDKNVLPRVHKVTYDSKNPGFQIALRKVEYVGLFKNRDSRERMIEDKCNTCKFFRSGKCSVLKQITEGRENEYYDRKEDTCIKFTVKQSY